MANFGARIDANAHVRPADKVGLCCAWRVVRLQLRGRGPAAASLFLGSPSVLNPNREEVKVTPKSAVRAVTHDEALHGDDLPLLAQLSAWLFPPPPGPLLRVDAGDGIGCWIIVAPSATQHAAWLLAISDAIDFSHGAGSPFAEWSLGSRLGEGAFGAVREATRRSTGERCACKVVSHSFVARHGDAPAALRREREVMDALASLPESAGLVRLVHSTVYGDDTFFFLSPLCEGDLLRLVNDAPFGDRRAAQLTRAMLHSVHAMHEAGHAHLDVKPQNYLWRSGVAAGGAATAFELHDGRPAQLFLADFGCARKVASPTAMLKSDGGGTLHYSPPEELEEQLQGAAADVWAVGCCAYCALFHRAPFSVSSDSEEMVRLRILRAKPAYDGGAASAAARAVLERLLARDWRSRPTAAQALRLAGAWLDGAKLGTCRSGAGIEAY